MKFKSFQHLGLSMLFVSFLIGCGVNESTDTLEVEPPAANEVEPPAANEEESPVVVELTRPKAG